VLVLHYNQVLLLIYKPVQTQHVVAPVTNAAKATGNAISKGAKKIEILVRLNGT
jgi:hypothetical protein